MRRLLTALTVTAALLLAGCSGGSGGGVGTVGGGPGSESTTTATPSSPAPGRADRNRARQIVDGWSDAQLAGGVMIVRYDGTTPEAAALQVSNLHAAGVIVMGYNVSSADQVQASARAVQDAARQDGRDYPAIVTVDQEGGTVTRLSGVVPQLPAFMSAGAAIRADRARGTADVTDASEAAGEQLRSLGFTWVFAPDADVTIGPSDPTIGSRSASDDPDLVSEAVTAAVTGYADAHIVSAVKHYPGHGSVTADSHKTLPTQDASLEELRRRDFKPFRAAADAGVPVMMMSHIAYPPFEAGVPSSLSPKAYQSLREETGFDGVIVTDALDMEAVTQEYPGGEASVKALAAGADAVLMPKDAKAAHTAIVAALGNGTLDRDQVKASAARVVALQLWQQEGADPPARGAADQRLREASQALSADAITQVSGECRAPVQGTVRVAGGTEKQRSAFLAAAHDAGLSTSSGPTVTLVGKSGATGSITVAVDTPYVLDKATGTSYALYGDDETAFRALMDVLTGKQPARGALPVTVSGVDPVRC